ncbi:MAG: branched-chain amino acid ABC transporter permease [Clostridia bacterium]|nr:branched-chain amino acid ABC transporter permease [Clostridia bacterium]
MKKVNFKKFLKGNALTYLMVIAAYVILLLMQTFGLMTNSLAGFLVPICAYIVMAVSLNLTVGIMGELSLGHAGFMSVGAYTGAVCSALLADLIPIAPLRLAIAMVGGGILAGVVSLIVVVPVLRLRGDYLAIVTLAFGEIIRNIMQVIYIGKDAEGVHFAMSEAALNLAEDGKMIVRGPMGVVGIQKISTLTMGFILVMITLVVVLNLIRSRQGRAIMAMRDNRIAAESVGISIAKYKIMAFVTSAVLAGAAGALYAMNFSSILSKKFDFNTSILVLVFVVLGGMGNIRGSIIAAAALTILPELLREYADYRMLVYAIVLIVVMLVSNNPKIKPMAEKIWGEKIAPKLPKKKAKEGTANGK